MKLLLSLCFALSTYFASAGIEFIMIPYRVVSDSVNPKLTVNQTHVMFKIQNPEFNNADFSVILKTSVNGVWKDVKLSENGSFEYLIEPGKAAFQFYVNNAFYELYVPELKLLPQHDVLVELNFQAVYESEMIIVDKPVIYLSSDQPTDFKLNVKPNGKFTFTYPEIKSGWEGSCNAGGTIAVNGKQYPYLFWESAQTYHFKPTENGYKVSKENVTAFLERKCEELGFSDHERTDFITYWGPRMMQFDELFVQFHIDEDCDQFAEMEISPSPTHINRVYIAISEWNEGFESFVSETSLPKMERGGFTVVEWGGFQFDLRSLEISNK